MEIYWCIISTLFDEIQDAIQQISGEITIIEVTANQHRKFEEISRASF